METITWRLMSCSVVSEDPEEDAAVVELTAEFQGETLTFTAEFDDEGVAFEGARLDELLGGLDSGDEEDDGYQLALALDEMLASVAESGLVPTLAHMNHATWPALSAELVQLEEEELNEELAQLETPWPPDAPSEPGEGGDEG